MSSRDRRLVYLLGLLLAAVLGHFVSQKGPPPAPQPPAAAVAAPAGGLQGKVVGVHDGDTLTVLDDANQTHKIRMAQIDAPELAQPYGKKAKQALSGLVYGQRVSVSVEETDRYGRSVGTVWVSATDVNRTMVQQGNAWAYRDYLKDKTLITDESAAQQAGAGLWALPAADRQPPWQFRRIKRNTHKN